jgi:hypothetical protein
MPTPAARRHPGLGPAAGALLLALAGCAEPQALAANPNPPVPALPADPQPLPPVSAVALVWQPAHYDWTGATYQYVAGRYIAQAGHTRWADGWWSLDGARWVWVPAHWAG